MGTTYSHLEIEKRTWTEHTLYFDENTRRANLNSLWQFENGSDMYLAFQPIQFGGIKYQHWFVTDKVHYIEFGSPTRGIYDAKVTINTYDRSNYNCDESNKKQMDEEMRERIRDVLGMCNYSLCLRNCEHVANYIFRRSWTSCQMSCQGNLFKWFKSYLMEQNLRLVNTFPYTLRLKPENSGQEKIYSFLRPHYSFSRTDYYLECAEDTFNVLIIGPTGGGKSNLINVIFNKNICISDSSFHSVTRETFFVRGGAFIYNHSSKTWISKSVVVADTIGLCDTEWDDEKVVALLKGRVSSNFKTIHAVFIVFREGRLLKEMKTGIEMILNWLDYHRNYLRIHFVVTNSENLTGGKKQELKNEIKNILRLGSKTHANSFSYVGFPSENSLNDQGRLKVKQSFDSLQNMLTYQADSNPINLDRKKTWCTFL